MSDTAHTQAVSQVESIVAMVAALECDFDRLEELRELAKTPRFIAGYNMPGYMPDSEPAVFGSISEARAYIADEMETHNYEVANFGNDEVVPVSQEAIDECRNGESLYGSTFGNWHYWVTQDGAMIDEEESAREELAELEAQANDCEDAEEAQQRIQDDPLSVEYRSGWSNPGEDLTPEEFRVVLCTGGPHVEIVGDLNQHGEPASVRVLYRDWGTSGELFDFDHDAVLTYCAQIISI